MQEDGGNASDLYLNEAGEEPAKVVLPREEARAGELADALDASSGLDLNQESPSPPLPKIEIKIAEAEPRVPGDATPNQADAEAEERRLRELLLEGAKQEKQEEPLRAKSPNRSADVMAPEDGKKKKERKRGRSRSRSRSRSRDRKHRSSRQEAKDSDNPRSERRRSRDKPEKEDSVRSRRKRSRSREERKRRSRSRERSKRERRSRSREKKREEKKKRSRSRSRERKREKKKKRERSRSRSRSRERSRDRRERKRSRRSRSKGRERSRDRRSKSRERSRDRRRSRSRSRERVKRWDVKKEDEWVEKQPTLPAATAAPVVGPAMVPTQLLLARLAGYPTAGLTYPGAPANPLPAPPPVQPAHVDPEEERRRKLQALAGYGQDRGAMPHGMDAHMPMGLGFKPDKHGPMMRQPSMPGMSVSVPIGKKNVIFKGWKKGETVTQDDIKRDTSGSSTSLQSLSDNTKSTVQVHERNFNDCKITGGVGFKMLQKMGWGGDALGKHEDGIVEPIAITMNPGTRGLCGADEKAQGKKKNKKGGLRGPTTEPPNNPNYSYVKCRFDPNHVVPEQRLAKHELNCPANPNPASHKAQLKRQNMLINSSSAAVTGHKKQRPAYDRYRPPPVHTPGVGPAPAFSYGHSLPPTPTPAAVAAYQQQQYAMWTAYQQQQQQQQQAYGWPGAPTPRT